jgi:hypothetical protein
MEKNKYSDYAKNLKLRKSMQNHHFESSRSKNKPKRIPIKFKTMIGNSVNQDTSSFSDLSNVSEHDEQPQQHINSFEPCNQVTNDYCDKNVLKEYLTKLPTLGKL